MSPSFFLVLGRELTERQQQGDVVAHAGKMMNVTGQITKFAVKRQRDATLSRMKDSLNFANSKVRQQRPVNGFLLFFPRHH